MSKKRALVVGVTGTTGYSTAKRLVAEGWEVHGISRRPAAGLEGIVPIHVDVLDPDSTAAALEGGGFTHVFLNIWIRQSTEEENRRINAGIVSDVLQSLRSEPVSHVALTTGLKHYIGPFESFATARATTPFREEQNRLELPNFYYDQEDALFAAAARDGFTWSVHRPHTVIGWGPTNSMNMGATLAAYAAICRKTGKPFVFPGSPTQYEGIVDVTDVRLLAEQLIWAATEPAAADQALNVVNGDVFRWDRMWEVVADALEVRPAPYPGRPTPLQESMAGMEPVWEELVRTHGLLPNPLDSVATWWHTDADLGRPTEAFADMTKSRALGFHGFRRTEDTFVDTFASLKEARIVP